jgi:hypothetical protein
MQSPRLCLQRGSPSCEALEPRHAARTMITAVHQQTGELHLPPQILTHLGEAGSRSRPDRQGFHVSCTAAQAELRQAGRTGSTELAILRGFATSNCPSARQRRVGRETVARLKPCAAIAAADSRLSDWRRGTDEVWRRRGVRRRGPRRDNRAGQFSGLLPAIDGLVYAVSYGAGRWLVRDETKDQRFRLRWASGLTPASTGRHRPCKQRCAHRRAAREIRPASARRHRSAGPGGQVSSPQTARIRRRTPAVALAA